MPNNRKIEKRRGGNKAFYDDRFPKSQMKTMVFPKDRLELLLNSIDQRIALEGREATVIFFESELDRVKNIPNQTDKQKVELAILEHSLNWVKSGL